MLYTPQYAELKENLVANPQFDQYVSTPFNGYVKPQLDKLEAQTAHVYEKHAAKYVACAHNKITANKYYQLITPYATKYYAVAADNLDKAGKVSCSTAKHGFNKAQLYSKVAWSKTNVYYRSKVVPFVVNDLVPFLKAKSEQSVVLANTLYHTALTKSKEYYKIIVASSISFYNETFIPIYLKHADPKLQTALIKLKEQYNKYLATHITKGLTATGKYYKVLKIDLVASQVKSHFFKVYEIIVLEISKYYNQLIQKKETKETVADSTFESLEVESSTELTNTEVAEIKETPTSEAVESKEEIEAEAAAEDEEIEELIPEETATVEPIIESNVPVHATSIEDSEITLTLMDEIMHWNSFIEQTIDNIFNNFNKSIEDLQTRDIEEFKPILTASLQNITTLAQQEYNRINKIIFNINSTSAILPNGEEVEVDKLNNIIDHKISRQEFRDVLSESSELLANTANSVNDKLQKLIAKIEEEVENERKLIIDIYEEFAEVSINEFSKKMMYSSYSNSFNQIEKDETDEKNFNDWKEYVKTKNFIIKKRDDLTNQKVELNLVQNLLNEVHFTLKTLEQEKGSYFAILRAKANIEFQSREERERYFEEHPDEEYPGDDEPLTITSTSHKTVTVKEDGDVSFAVEPSETLDAVESEYSESATEAEAEATATATPEPAQAEEEIPEPVQAEEEIPEPVEEIPAPEPAPADEEEAEPATEQ